MNESQILWILFFDKNIYTKMISKKKNIAIRLGDEAFNYIIDTVVFY